MKLERSEDAAKTVRRDHVRKALNAQWRKLVFIPQITGKHYKELKSGY